MSADEVDSKGGDHRKSSSKRTEITRTVTKKLADVMHSKPFSISILICLLTLQGTIFTETIRETTLTGDDSADSQPFGAVLAAQDAAKERAKADASLRDDEERRRHKQPQQARQVRARIDLRLLTGKGDSFRAGQDKLRVGRSSGGPRECLA